MSLRHKRERFKVSKVKYVLKNSGWLNEFVSMWVRCKSYRWVVMKIKGLESEWTLKYCLFCYHFFSSTSYRPTKALAHLFCTCGNYHFIINTVYILPVLNSLCLLYNTFITLIVWRKPYPWYILVHVTGFISYYKLDALVWLRVCAHNVVLNCICKEYLSLSF